MSELQNLHIRFCQHSLVFKGNSPRTIDWFKTDFRWFLGFAKIERLDQLTKHQIEDWIMYGKLERAWVPKTIRLRLQSLSLFMDWCVQEGYVKDNPCNKIPRPKLPKSIPKHLTPEQTEKLLDWTKNFKYTYKFDRTRSLAIISTFIYTGIRKAELINLKVSDIDLDNKSLFVKQGKCSKDRIVPLHDSLIEVLTRYLKDRNRLGKTCPYFFTAMRQDSKMGESVIKRLIEKIKEKSGIHFYPHLLRHTFATLMLEGGCNLFALSQMMGHSDIKTTTIYLSATKSHLQEQITKHPIS